MEMEALVTFEVGDTLAVVDGRAAYCSVYVVTLFEEQFGQIGAVLSCDTGDQCGFHNNFLYLGIDGNAINDDISRFPGVRPGNPEYGFRFPGGQP